MSNESTNMTGGHHLACVGCNGDGHEGKWVAASLFSTQMVGTGRKRKRKNQQNGRNEWNIMKY